MRLSIKSFFKIIFISAFLTGCCGFVSAQGGVIAQKDALQPSSVFNQIHNDESNLSAPLGWGDVLIQGNALNITKMLSYVKPENLDKAKAFIEHEKTRMLSVFKFLRDKNIVWSGEFFQYFLSRTQKSVLSDIETLRGLNFQEKEGLWSLVRKLFWVELEANRKKNVIKDLLTSMRNTFESCEKAQLDLKASLGQMNSLLQDYAEDRIGNKKVLSQFEAELRRRMSEALKLFFTHLSGEGSLNNDLKIDRFLEKYPDLHLYLMNLTGIYYRIRNSYPESARHLERALSEMVLNPAPDGNLETFHHWLYQESPWNKAIYQELTTQSGYSPLLWEKGLSRTFFVNSKATEETRRLAEKIRSLQSRKNQKEEIKAEVFRLQEEIKKIRKEEEKIRVEFTFDFLKDTYSGVPLHDCFTPGKDYEMIPVFHALETNALFMRVYNDASGQMMTSIVYVLTPEGLIDLGFASGSALLTEPLKQPVFEVLAELVNNNWVPAVNMNSDRTAYVASAGYPFGSQMHWLKAKVVEAFKQEPWDIEREKDPLGGPRHYANGSNSNRKDAQGRIRQYGRFKTAYRLEKKNLFFEKSLEKYEYHSLENILKNVIPETRETEDPEGQKVFDQLRLRLLREEEDIKKTSPLQGQRFRDQMVVNLKTLQLFLNEKNLPVTELSEEMEELKKQLAPSFWILLMKVLQGGGGSELNYFLKSAPSVPVPEEKLVSSLPTEKSA